MTRPGDPTRLTTSEIGFLRQLGDAVRSAPRRSRLLVVVTVVQAIHPHRRSGVPWAEISVALGFAESTVRRWHRNLDQKPSTPIRKRTAPTTIPTPRDKPAPRDKLLTAQETIESQRTTDNSRHELATADDHDIGIAASTPGPRPRPHRRVLVLAGDPRPGENDFDGEVEAIRSSLEDPLIAVHVVTGGDAGEISRSLDHVEPNVLHVAAHSTFGGLWLTLDDDPLVLDLAAFTEVLRCSFRPQLVVLNFCGSTAMSRVLSGLVRTVVTWPGAVRDRDLRLFAGHFYKALRYGRSVERALAVDCAAVRARLVGVDWAISAGDTAATHF